MKGLLFFDPYAGTGRNELLLKVLRWTHATDFSTLYPEIWKHMVPFFNKVIDKSWTVMKSQGVSQKTWFASIKPFCGKLLDIGAWETCLKADKDWSLVRDDLQQVSATIVGQRVFAQALRNVAAGTVSSVIDKALVQLMGSNTKLTAASLKANKDQLEAALRDAGHSLHIASKPRNIDLKYRGIVYLAQVSSFLEEYDLKVAAFVKGLGCKLGKLPDLFCESDLVMKDMPMSGAELDDSLLSESHLARTEAAHFAEAYDKVTGAEVKELITGQHKVLAALDRCWKVELNFWLSQCGATGEDRMKEQLLEAFPTVTAAKPLEDVNTCIKKLMASKLYQFVNIGLQSEIATVQGWVGAMLAFRNPPISKLQSENPLYQKVMELLPNFARSVDQGVTKVGREAVLVMIEKVKAMNEFALSDLKCFARFNWLLNEEERKLVKGWLQTVASSAIAGAAGAAPPKGQGSSASKPAARQPAAKRRKVTDESVLRAATKALFR